MSDVFDELLRHWGITIETGGVSPILFALPLGMMVLRHDVSAPNFVRDVALLEKEPRTPPDETSAPADLFPAKKKQSAPLFLIIGIIGVVAFLTGGYLLMARGTEGPLGGFMAAPTVTPTPTVLPTVTPTPTINPSLKRSDVTVEVRNGTGTTGYAKDIGAFLTEKGYTGVKAANADRDDYEQTTVAVTDDKKEYLQLFLQDIREKFPAASAAQPQSEQASDIVVILGKQ